MKSQKVRQSFIDFFEARGHEVVPRSSVVPWDDPTLLFTNAGMNQFTDVFLGQGTRSYRRATDAQTVIRAGGKHNDLEDVGKDTYHQTLFEMLGNWSFGDYYKRETIGWAWELLTDVWQIPRERLWATVFRDDDEAESLWLECTDINRSQVLRFDEKDNFWGMGDTGPCGPCSEIHYDYGPDRCTMNEDPAHVCGVNADCGRFMEIWNLVFIQYNRGSDGSLTPLPEKHVDTGMGFERVVAIKQGVASNYDTDLFQPLIDEIARLTGKPYGDETTAMAMRVLADHVRTLAFAVTDGALPSNEGRGYVLRRILRRASRFGRTLGQHDPFLYRLVPKVIEIMAEAYPELLQSRERIETVIRSEEEGFGRTLDRGIALFEDIANAAVSDGRTVISGSEAFKLYDTFGFPVDLTQVMAEEKDLSVDIPGFESEMQRQKDRSRGSAATSTVDTDHEIDISDITVANSVFVGYDCDSAETRIAAVGTGWVALERTPFYGESGGQVGDTGWLTTVNGEKYRIVDTQRKGDVILHLRDMEDGRPLNEKTDVTAVVDAPRRESIQKNHTATHLLHAALRSVLGEHVCQTGSLVAPDRLRFDFSHISGMTGEEIDRVERTVNECIWMNRPVTHSSMALDEAKESGAMALFGEKYGDEVHVVQVEGISKELCGGTHLSATGQTGPFRILRESSVASGVRRIEAVTGEAAYESTKQNENTLATLAGVLKVDSGEMVDRAGNLVQRVRDLEREVKRLNSASTQNWLDEMVSNAIQAGPVATAAKQVECADSAGLRDMADSLRGGLSGPAVGVLFAEIKSRPMLIAVVTDEAISGFGLSAGKLVKKIGAIIGGNGGGKAHMAQAGGKDSSRIPEAIDKVPKIVSGQLD